MSWELLLRLRAFQGGQGASVGKKREISWDPQETLQFSLVQKATELAVTKPGHKKAPLLVSRKKEGKQRVVYNLLKISILPD